MKKITTGTIVLVILGLGAFVWPTRYRYGTVKVGENTLTMRLDRFSDKTWMLTPTGWVPSRATEKPPALPTTQGVGARCRLLAGEVYCDISNETEYTLYRVTVKFYPYGKPDSSPTSQTLPPDFIPVSCTADLKGTVEPHTMGLMTVKPPCQNDLTANKWTWEIVAAAGTKDK